MILIFGGNGFIGQHTAKTLIDRGERVVVTSRNANAEPVLLSEAIRQKQANIEPLDITDTFGVMECVSKYKPHTIMDLTGQPPKLLSPSQDVNFRMQALMNILEASRQHDVERLVLQSSMDAYWGLDASVSAPFTEETHVPLIEADDNFMVQSWAKKSLEVIGNMYRRQAGLNVIFVRAAGVYGPLYRTFYNLPSRLARQAATGQEDFSTCKGGLPYREDGYDQIFVRDMANGLAMIITAKTLRYPVYNLGSGMVQTAGMLLDAVRTCTKDFHVNFQSRKEVGSEATPPTAHNGCYMSIDRIKEELGFEPQYDLQSAMMEYVDWLRSHPC